MKKHKIINFAGIVSMLALVLLITRTGYALQYKPLQRYTSGTNILSAFQLVKNIVVPRALSIPTVIEFALNQSEVGQQPYLLYEVETDTPVHTLIQTTKDTPPIRISRSVFGGDDIPQLHDESSSTFEEVSTDGTEIVSSFFYESDRLITSSLLLVNLAQNAYGPASVSIYAYDVQDNTRKLVLSKVPLTFSNVRFPQTSAYRWEVIFNHTQPLRMAELKFLPDTPIQRESTVLRFLAQPGKMYRLYLSPDRPVNTPVAEYTNLNDPVDNIVRISAPVSETNSYYQKADIDLDGIEDTIDNCPTTINADQADINSNNIGDACEDFDRDGVMNNRDNCPDNPNGGQNDEDADGYGDICDPEESRLTERIWWLPWLGIIVGFGTVLFIFKTTVQSKKKEQSSR